MPTWFQRGYGAPLARPIHVAHMKAEKAALASGRQTDVPCPVCGHEMVIRVNRRTGVPFLGCSAFPKCDTVLAAWGRRGELVPGEDPAVECQERAYLENEARENDAWFNMGDD